MFRLQSRRLVASAIAPVALFVLGACASPTEPQLEDVQAPKRNFVCMSAGRDGTPVFSPPVNDECPSGFDLIPWW